jgi:hypothetical protein
MNGPTLRNARFRSPRVDWSFVAVAAIAASVIVWIGRDLSFFHDEWAFIVHRDLTPRSILEPHAEHLSATLVIAYRILVETVGTATYAPYLGALLALHLAVGGMVFALVRREAGRSWALGAMLLFLLFGAGGENILWAFQMGFVGAMAAGTGAIIVAPRQPALAAVLLCLGVATSGVALAFVVGTAVQLLLTRPRASAWLALPLGGYQLWYVAIGSGAVGAHRSPSLEGVPEFVATGIAATAAGVLGTENLAVGGVALVILVVAMVLARPVSPTVASLLAAGLAFFVITGLVRAQLGAGQADTPRYLYVLAPALLVAAAIALSRLRAVPRVAVGLVLALAIAGNVNLLVQNHDSIRARIQCEQALSPAARGMPGNPC